ncbi:MAG: hypothetical protein ACLQRH_11240 [Acidimicrobiales bacterium]
MAYDEALAQRIRELNTMAVATSGGGGLLVRVDPAQSDALVARSLPPK